MSNKSVVIDVSLKEQSLRSFEELNKLIERSEKNAKELKNATIALDKARAKGGRGTVTQVNRVNRALAKEVELVTLLKNKQQQLDAVNKKLNATRKKSIGLMRTMSNVAGRLVAIYAVLLGTFRAIGKLKNTLVVLDGFRFAMEKITGSSAEAAEAFNFVTKVSENFGTSLETTAERYVKFSTAARQAGLSLGATQSIFNSMSKASGVLGLRTDEVKGVFLALEQMLSKGKVTTEELRRQLGERLPGAMGMMVTAYNRLHPKQEVTLSQFDKLLKKGKVLSHEVLPEFARVVEETLGIQMVNSVDTLQASITRADTAFTIMVRDMEEGTGAMANIFKAFYDTLANIWKDIGELFLTADEERRKYYTKGLAQGKLYLKQLQDIDMSMTTGEPNTGFLTEEDQKEGIGKRLSEELQTILMKYREIRDRIGKEPIQIEVERKDPITGVTSTFLEDVLGTGEQPGDDKRLDYYAEEFGKIKGALIAMGHAADENLPKIDPDDETGKKPFYLPEIDPGSIDGLKQAIKLAKELRDAASIAGAKMGELDQATAAMTVGLDEDMTMGDFDAMVDMWQAELDYLEDKITFEEYINSIYKDRPEPDEPFEFDTFEMGFNALLKKADPAGGGIASMAPLWLAEYTKIYDEDLTNFGVFLQKKLKAHNKNLKEQGKATKVILDEEAEARERLLAGSIELGNQLFDLGGAILENKIEHINAEIIATEEKYDKLHELANGDAEMEKNIARQKEHDLKKLHKEELKLRQQQAKVGKAQAIANAIINTAVGVTAALGLPVAGIALAAITAAIGAAQIATIIAQPIPQYAQGRLGGREELAIVGDGGRKEVIETSNGAYLTPNTPTLAYLQKGDSVYKNQDIYRDTILKSIIGATSNALELKNIEDAISKGFKKATVNNYLKMPKVDINIGHEIWMAKNSEF